VQPPETARQAVDLLLSQCPEFVPAWDDVGWEGTGSDGGMGIYGIWTDLLATFFEHAIPRTLAPGEVKSGHRRWFEGNFRKLEDWEDVPDAGPALDNMVERVFEVIDAMAASPNPEIRNAVFIEMIATGFMTREDLLTRAGPMLRAMVEQEGSGA
jgi:hypothetical protein